MTHFKVRARPRPNRAPPAPKGCDERGCREPWTVECWLYDAERSTDVLDGRYCGPHAELAGFCRSCGVFAAGTEGFDFGRPSGLCDNCRSSEGDDVDSWEDILYALEPDEPDVQIILDEPGRIEPGPTARLIDDLIGGGRR